MITKSIAIPRGEREYFVQEQARPKIKVVDQRLFKEKISGSPKIKNKP